MSSFWHNTIWYILLGVTSISVLLITFIKSHNRRFNFAFWAGVLGFTYLLEIILVFGLNAYTYQPLIVKDKIQDTIIGNFFSQFSVSSSALIICVFRLSAYWRIGLSIVYFLVDLFFSHIGIYTHNWYESIFSLPGFFVYSLIISKWFALLQERRDHKLLTNASLFLAVYAAAGNSIITSLNLTQIQMFNLPITGEAATDHLYGSQLYGPALILILMLLHKAGMRFVYKALILLMLVLVQYWLFAIGFMKVKEGWFIIAALADIMGYYVWVTVLDRFMRSRLKA